MFFFSVFWGHQKARFTALRLSLGAELQQFKGSPATDQPKRLSQQGDSIPIPLARHEDVKVKTVFFGWRDAENAGCKSWQQTWDNVNHAGNCVHGIRYPWGNFWRRNFWRFLKWRTIHNSWMLSKHAPEKQTHLQSFRLVEDDPAG